jgi:hypothetical protein
MNSLTWDQATVILGVYIVGFYSQMRHIDRVKDAINKCFDEMEKRFDEMDKRFDDLRLERPLVKTWNKGENES